MTIRAIFPGHVLAKISILLWFKVPRVRFENIRNRCHTPIGLHTQTKPNPRYFSQYRILARMRLGKMARMVTLNYGPNSNSENLLFSLCWMMLTDWSFASCWITQQKQPLVGFLPQALQYIVWICSWSQFEWMNEWMNEWMMHLYFAVWQCAKEYYTSASSRHIRSMLVAC